MKKIIQFSFSLILLSFLTSLSFSQTTYTLEDVGMHSSEEDCWVVFEEKVYDVTEYVANHDRFMDIREWCGGDMTEDFKDKAGADRDHREGTYELLETYYIGDLVESSDTEEMLMTYTLEEIATHNTQDDCWSVFEGDVYDITEYVADHDRFMDIRQWCGGDMTQDFKDKAGAGRDHRDGSYELLASYKIGTVAEPETIHENDYGENNQKESYLTETYSEGRPNPYNVWVPMVTVIVLYLIGWGITKTEFSKKSNIFNKRNFNLFWNIVLVLSLVPSLIFGLIMALQFQFSELSDIANNLYWMHVEGSILFGTVGVMHLLTRFNRFIAPLKAMFRKD